MNCFTLTPGHINKTSMFLFPFLTLSPMAGRTDNKCTSLKKENLKAVQRCRWHSPFLMRSLSGQKESNDSPHGLLHSADLLDWRRQTRDILGTPSRVIPRDLCFYCFSQADQTLHGFKISVMKSRIGLLITFWLLLEISLILYKCIV